MSAIIDPYGRLLAELPLGEAGVLDGTLPDSIAPTPFAGIGGVVPLAAVCLLLTGILAARYGARRGRKRDL